MRSADLRLAVLGRNDKYELADEVTGKCHFPEMSQGLGVLLRSKAKCQGGDPKVGPPAGHTLA